MKIYINDTTNSAKPLYYQSLVLLFLPCEKFGENDSENSLHIKAYQLDGKNCVSVLLQVGDKESEKYDEQVIDSSVYAQMKNLIGRTILSAAYDIFGTTPPWGISTGVKPVKLAGMYVKSIGREKALNVLRNEYKISPRKAEMAVSAYDFEYKLMNGIGDKPCSLYISIPFCPTKCNYCSFVSCTTPKLLSLIPDYINKLNYDISIISDTIKELGLNLKSVYVGGGTPAILSAAQIDSVMSTVFSKLPEAQSSEFTFEAGRPDCITAEKLRVLRDYGVPRISINTQTTNDEILKNVGRSHTYSDYVKAMDLAKSMNFKCINTDLIAGLPGESAESFKNSVKDVVSLEPENITVHAFTLKKASNYRVGGAKGFDTNHTEALEMTDFASEYLFDNGYNPYYVYRQKNTTGNLENVGYSKPGFESIYNVIMMGEYHTVFGAGAGSVTKIVSEDGNRVDRLFSPKYPYEYLDDKKYSCFDKNAVLKLYEER